MRLYRGVARFPHFRHPSASWDLPITARALAARDPSLRWDDGRGRASRRGEAASSVGAFAPPAGARLKRDLAFN
jgi:hypothetical protein